MSRTPKKPPLALDMDFDEALRRFAKVDPKEIKRVTEKKKSATSKKRR